MWVALALALAAGPVSEGWQEAGRSDGVIVYVRAREKSPALKETLAVGAIDAPPWVVKNAIDDYEAKDGAMPYLREMRVLSRDARGTLIYHRTSPPLVSDRDYTIRMSDESWVRDDDSVVYFVRWRVANDAGPPPRIGVVRVTETEGYWQLEPLDGGKRTRATYYVFADPGGSVPNSLAQWGTNTMMGSIFNAMRERVRARKYWQEQPTTPTLSRGSSRKP